MELMSNGDIIGLVIPNLLSFGTLVLKCFCRNGIVFLPRIIIFLDRLAKPVGFFFFQLPKFSHNGGTCGRFRHSVWTSEFS